MLHVVVRAQVAPGGAPLHWSVVAGGDRVSPLTAQIAVWKDVDDSDGSGLRVQHEFGINLWFIARDPLPDETVEDVLRWRALKNASPRGRPNEVDVLGDVTNPYDGGVDRVVCRTWAGS